MVSKRDEVATKIRELIATEHYHAGDRLPTEHELASLCDAGRSTVHQALKQLVLEGLLTSTQGSGHIVRDRSQLVRVADQRLTKRTRDANQGTHLAEAAQIGQSADVSTRIYVEEADSQAAAALELSTGAEVLVRDRVMRIGEQPTQLAVSRYPRTLTRDTAIEQLDTGPGGVLSRLEDAGHTIAGHTERVTVHRATAEEAAALQLPAGSACLRVQRTTRSDTGRVLEVTTMTLVDRYVLLYEIDAQ